MVKGRPASKPPKLAIKDRLRQKLLASRQFICLVAIVRREADNIERLLSSLRRSDGTFVIQGVSFADNGPIEEKETEEVTRNFCVQNGLELAYHRVPWVNFGVNRTQSVELAKQSFPQATYFLLTDADFVWEVDYQSKMFDPRLLFADQYLVKQSNRSESYWNIRMLSSRLQWECRGSTHEYWTIKGSEPYQREKLHTLHIDDREDGGFKAHKFERDLVLLHQDLENPQVEEGDKMRAMFYLAQTYRDLGKIDESIEWYLKRWEKKGWAEEHYYAGYQIGLGYEKKGFQYLRSESQASPDEQVSLRALKEDAFELACTWYQRAWELRKTRGEALYRLVRLLRVTGRSAEALKWARHGEKLAYPDDTLFLDNSVYPTAFLMEMAYNAGILKDFELGRPYCYYLQEHRNELPPYIRMDLPNIFRLYN